MRPIFRKRRSKCGRTRIKLADLLQAELRKEPGLETLEINPESLWRQEGACSHMTWDLCRWGIDLRCGPIFLHVHSYDAMKLCVKHGIKIEPVQGGVLGEREVFSKI